jgi:hypothetical protein
MMKKKELREDDRRILIEVSKVLQFMVEFTPKVEIDNETVEEEEEEMEEVNRLLDFSLVRFFQILQILWGELEVVVTCSLLAYERRILFTTLAQQQEWMQVL